MRVEISNLGAIRKAVVDLDKPFTLFCGPNSTGKTYLSYLIYAILESADYVVSKKLDGLLHFFSANKEFVLTREFVENYIADFSANIKGKLGSIFGIGDSTVDKLFSQFSISLILSDEDYCKIINKPCRFGLKNNGKEIVLAKEEFSDKIVYYVSGEDVSVAERENLTVLQIVINHFFSRLCFQNMGGVRMLTVERNSIYTFKTELSLSRNELVDRIQQQSATASGLDILEVINGSSRRYPLAVRDSLKIANDLENIKKNIGPYYEIAEQIEKGILQGSVQITDNGDVEFVSDKMEKNKHLPIHMTSSIVKTISSLVIYLKHIARKGDLLIVDEPEMNFHPDVQVLLTRIFALLSKQNLRIIISTHSDYIIREINNLIMAENIYSKNPQLVTDLGYDSSMLLNKNDIAIKYFNFGKRKKNLDVVDVEIDNNGFAVESIDNTINEQNRITETLFYSLEED